VDKLSLLEHCQKCDTKCCEASTILSEKEANLMIFLWGKEFLIQHTGPSGEKYWIPNDHPGTSTCIFLKDGKCQAQSYKPLNCRCYPLKAILQGEKIVFVVDETCPAAAYLSPQFLEQAKKAAKFSLSRFRPETFKHWLANHIGWVAKSAKIIK